MKTPLKAAVLGWPVNHSLSPRLHGYWLKHYGLTGSYEARAVKPEDLRQALKNLQGDGYCGVNLTIPHKEAALGFVDRLDAAAQHIGAVNTIVIHADGRLEGRNTDAYGFTQNILSAGFQHRNRPAVLCGAGGAARSAIVALLDLGVPQIRILNRTIDKAQKLADEFGPSVSVHALQDAKALQDVSLLANATSLGMKGQPALDIDLATLPRDALVTDMVYAPLQTDLLLRAAARGNPVIDGLGMLLHQARPAFQAFFGVDPAVTEALRIYVLEAR